MKFPLSKLNVSKLFSFHLFSITKTLSHLNSKATLHRAALERSAISQRVGPPSCCSDAVPGNRCRRPAERSRVTGRICLICPFVCLVDARYRFRSPISTIVEEQSNSARRRCAAVVQGDRRVPRGTRFFSEVQPPERWTAESRC